MFQNILTQMQWAFSSFLVTQIFHLKFLFKIIFFGYYTYSNFSCKIIPACSCPRLHNYCGEWEGWDPVNWFNHTSWVAIVTPTDRPKSVRNRCVIEVFCVVFVFSSCFLDCSVSVGAFVIGLSQISSFFTCDDKPWTCYTLSHRIH